MKLRKLFRRSFANKLNGAKKMFIQTHQNLLKIGKEIENEMGKNQEEIDLLMDEQDLLATQLNVTKQQIEEISKFI